MDSKMFEVINQSLFPLFVSYLPVIGVTVIFAWIIASQFCTKQTSDRRNETSSNSQDTSSQKHERSKQAGPISSKTSKKKHSEKWSRESKQNFSHEWLLTSLKGHTGPILDMSFSSNGKFLATCAEDRAVFIWNTKDWKDKEHKFVRYNVDFDHASLISWSPDSKAFIYNRHSDNLVEVCKVTKKADGWIQTVTKALTYPNLHKTETIGLGIAVNGKYIMTCSSGTDIVLWDLKGAELARLDTYLMNNFAAKISPCAKFVAASGFAPDVKVWEVVFAKTGEFKQVNRAFELTGHSSGIYDFAFNSDSTVIATVSKDGTWRLYDIKIEYEKGEEPRLLKSGKFKTEGSKACLALSPDGLVLALSSRSSLFIINTLTSEVDKVIENIYPGGDITRIAFDSAGEYVLTTGEKHVRVFYNVTGYKTKIQSSRSKLQAGNISSATRERLESIIQESESFLHGIGEPSN